VRHRPGPDRHPARKPLRSTLFPLAAAAALLAPLPLHAAPVLNPANGHYYEVVWPGRVLTWEEAHDEAAASTYLGMQGYLATITSAEEQAFIEHLLEDFLEQFPVANHTNFFLAVVTPPRKGSGAGLRALKRAPSSGKEALMAVPSPAPTSLGRPFRAAPCNRTTRAAPTLSDHRVQHGTRWAVHVERFRTGPASLHRGVLPDRA
jgi:hypothetical protein